MSKSRNSDTGLTRVFITSLVRPGIHDHEQGCSRAMVNYGYDEHTLRQQSNSDPGQDVTDNVQSKTRAPSPIRMNNLHKRNSMDQSNHSMDYSYEDPNGSNTSTYLDETEEIEEESSLDHNIHWDRFSPERERRQSQNSNVSLYLLAVVVLFVAFFTLSDYKYPFNQKNKYTESDFYEDLNNVKEKFHVNDDSILQIQSAISTISDRQDTGSFIFAYRSSKENFNYEYFNDLIDKIALTASKYLRNESASVRHIVVDGSELHMRTYGELINKYKEDVSEKGVMLVREIHEVPPQLAMAFHYYCDEYNPLAKTTALFFTLDMSKCSQNPAEQKPTHDHIEKCLKSKWQSMHKDKIAPLLSRIVNTVVDVSGDQ